MSLPTLDNNDKKKKDKMPNLPVMPNIDDSEIEEMPEEQFKTLDVDEVYEDEDYENEELYEQEKYEELPVMNKDESNSMYLDDEEDYNPDYEEDLEKENEDKFIDKKNKRLLPFGGKKSKRKVTSSDFDDRKNILAKTKILRTIVMFFMIVIVLIGLRNTFFPNHIYTSDQIKQFAREGAGQTGFPSERGKAFVEHFMEAYLTLDRSDPDLLEVLSYYYGVDKSARLDTARLNIVVGRNVKQKILVQPKVYEINLLTPYSTQYKVSTYVSSTDGETELSKGRWLSFVVNVYYDAETNSLAITRDSPTIIPAYRIAQESVIPPRMPLGNGNVNQDIAPALNPTINGFVEAYAKSSIESHESILQYIDDKNDIDLYDGFGGAVKLKDTPANSIQRVIYDSDDGIYRADLTIDWVDTRATGEDGSITYRSRYIMRIKPIGDGKYAVSSFVPFNYYHNK